MTENQSAILVNSPNTKKAVAVLQKFAELESQYKELEKQKKEAEATLLQAMIDNDVTKLVFDSEEIQGYITLATRQNFKQVGDVAPKFTKKALDTAKVKAHYTLKGELPAGVEVSETKYLTKKIK